MDKEKLKKIQEDTRHFLNINDMKEVTPAMVHKHVAAEQSFREHIADSMDKHIEESGKFWHDNAEQLSIIKLSMEQKIDKMYGKIDENSKMTKEALELARNVNSTLQPLVDRINTHEKRLDEGDILKAEIKGGVRVFVMVFSIIAVFMSAFYYLYIQNIKREIGDQTIQRVQSGNVKVEEVAPNSGIFRVKFYEGK